ncbi:MAG: phosphotransferase [Anaerolineae bacterium]|nr:phosphotransferase [Anaerolineae bacterium]
MNKHPYFDLWLHDDRELASFTGQTIEDRITLHEWPLSCVQQLQLEDGRKLIYKSQAGPTVEPAFYKRAASPLLLSTETLWESDGHACMLIEFIEAPHLEDLDLPEDEAVRTGQEIVARIAEIKGDPPCYIDIGSADKWGQLVDATVRDLRGLVALGRFQHVTGDTVRELDRLARDPIVLEALERDPGLVHGDLGGDNVFRCPDGYKIIDWQRPIRGPRELDLMVFASRMGSIRRFEFDPLKYVHPGIAAMWAFLSAQWFTECKTRWIPKATDYDSVIANTPDEMKRFLT